MLLCRDLISRDDFLTVRLRELASSCRGSVDIAAGAGAGGKVVLLLAQSAAGACLGSGDVTASFGPFFTRTHKRQTALEQQNYLQKNMLHEQIR